MMMLFSSLMIPVCPSLNFYIQYSKINYAINCNWTTQIKKFDTSFWSYHMWCVQFILFIKREWQTRKRKACASADRSLQRMIIKWNESASLLVSERTQIAPWAFQPRWNIAHRATVQTVMLVRSIFYRHYPAYMNGKLNITELARVCDMSRTTVYKYIEILK